jgi:ribosomal protein S18 acetylase RimI-like enzyme
MGEVLIRPYLKNDRAFVRDIAWKTAFMGEPADAFFADREIFSDFLTAYFTDYEPESCFVAQDDKNVVGYLIGCKNTRNLNKTFLIRILPLLSVRLVIRKALFKKKNIVFLAHCLTSFFKGEFKMPRLPGNAQATFHINIKNGFRGQGIGSRLLLVFLDYLKKYGAKTVYMSTMSDKSGLFFESRGFGRFYRASRSYFRYILGRNITVDTFVKQF